MSEQGGHLYEFSEFRLDTISRRLLQGSEIVTLTPKVLDLLIALVESQGKILGKEELMRRLWPDTYVEEGNLTQNISVLRRTLAAGSPVEVENYIETIPRHGYRFIPPVREVGTATEEILTVDRTHSRLVVEEAVSSSPWRVRMIVALGAVILAGTVSWLWFGKQVRPVQKPGSETVVKSLAVLPLRSLDREAKDDHLELGMADTIIGRLSQIPGLTVRPMSAVRKFAGPDVDALNSARQLQVDAVLDGTVQRSGEHLRVRAGLVRVRDGASLWTETFDVRFTDIFSVQDEVARQVALRLRPNLSAVEQKQLARQSTVNPAAYEYYLAGLRDFDQRSLTKMGPAIPMFQKAIELDSNYALAYAQLAYAQTWMALFIEPDNPLWMSQARQSLKQAERLDPDLAETHVVRYELLWSVNEGFRIDEAIREIRRAQELRPVFNGEIGILLAHLGLEQQSLRELQRSMEVDPLSAYAKGRLIEAHELLGLFDEALAVSSRLAAGSPPVVSLLALRRLDEAQPLIEAQLTQNPSVPRVRAEWSLLLALRGRLSEAEVEIPKIARGPKDRGYHHAAESVAAVYALEGKAPEAVQWLRTTVETGMPNYTLFLRDPNLARIRSSPEFLQFMAGLKPRWDAMEREFR
jgi:DNA-binding winged helix-turn-helix (wHTH) protein/TolB-like protein